MSSKTNISKTIHCEDTSIDISVEMPLPSKSDPTLFYISAGRQFGECFTLNGALSHLGRSPECSICILDRTVSRRHATFTRESKHEVRLEDTFSSNGTFRNGQPVAPETSMLLQNGDHIRCGNVQFKFLSGESGDLRAWEELCTRAASDALTGLHNRGHFQTVCEAEFERAKRYETDLSVLIIDIDDFKRVNDAFGHTCGDYLLMEVASILRSRIRLGDTVGRWGGDEFVVILPQTESSAASVVAETLRTRVESHPFRFRGYDFRVTVSLGLASLNASHETFSDLLTYSDNSLLRAKRSGRNCVGIFEPHTPIGYVVVP